MKVAPIPPDERHTAEVEGWNAAPLLIVTVRATTGEQRVSEVVGVSETAWGRATPEAKAVILRRLAESFDRICATADDLRRKEGRPWTGTARLHGEAAS